MDKDDVVSLCRALLEIKQQLHRIADQQSRVIEYFARMKGMTEDGQVDLEQLKRSISTDEDTTRDPQGD